MSLVPLSEATAAVVDRCHPLPAVRWPVRASCGCVTAVDVVAAEEVPPFDNSAVDGFAVRAADTSGAAPDAPVRLTVVASVFAGQAPSTAVAEGQAVRIMTGAPMPAGADGVVMVEDTSVETADGVETVSVTAEAAEGAHVRRAGEDVRPGTVVVAAGTPLGPAHLGVLANTGAASVEVHPRPRVGVLSTGDELVDAPWPLGPGQIRDSNRVMLAALAERDGYEVVDLGRVPDDAAAIEAALRRGAATCDALVSSGGVSMGDADLVKAVLDDIADMEWMQVAIKPAKPFAFGVLTARGGRSVPVFGLPGNPVSSAVSYELLARPGLRRLAGHRNGDLVRPTTAAVAGADLRRRPDGKTHYVRVRTSRGPEGDLVVRPLTGQGSHQLTALADADALAVVPDGSGVACGDRVEALVL
ncbi:MAG: molybdopterin molybdotransferase MoeA [Acidimicrobiia bacterium]|nr:molybdopterin molybdotransferase MoeA [Acidimicrobiia bacterium]